MEPRGALGPELVRGAMSLGGILAEVVEPELIGRSLAEDCEHVAAEVFQLVEFLLHEALHRFHVAVVSGAVGRVEAAPAAAVSLLDQAGERRGHAAVIPGAAELAAIVGLHGDFPELDPAGCQVGQQAIAKQQGRSKKRLRRRGPKQGMASRAARTCCSSWGGLLWWMWCGARERSSSPAEPCPW